MTLLKLAADSNPRLLCGPTEASGHTQSPQGTPLEHQAWVAKGAYISGSHRTETIGGTVFGRLQPPGHNTDTLRLSVTKASLPVLELEGQA